MQLQHSNACPVSAWVDPVENFHAMKELQVRSIRYSVAA
jgi:hypothetical protein